MCEIRDNLDRVAEKKCLKKEGLWRKVPFSAEIFDDKRDKLMANDNGTRELFTSRHLIFLCDRTKLLCVKSSRAPAAS